MHISKAIPRSISAGSNFVVTTSVDIIRNPAGYDVRKQTRSETLRRADLAYNIRRIEDLDEQERSLYELLKHFEVCEGPLNTFPMLDRLDYKSCSPLDTPAQDDVVLGEGDGGNDTFQLRKGYTIGSVTKYRTILLPIEGTVLIAVDGSLKAEGGSLDYVIDYETGIVTFLPGSIPGTGSEVTAGFKFYVKVRFDTNDLSQAYEGFRVGAISSIPVIEVRQ